MEIISLGKSASLLKAGNRSRAVKEPHPLPHHPGGGFRLRGFKVKLVALSSPLPCSEANMMSSRLVCVSAGWVLLFYMGLEPRGRNGVPTFPRQSLLLHSFWWMDLYDPRESEFPSSVISFCILGDLPFFWLLWRQALLWTRGVRFVTRALSVDVLIKTMLFWAQFHKEACFSKTMWLGCTKLSWNPLKGEN